jgi:hypothetical protein
MNALFKYTVVVKRGGVSTTWMPCPDIQPWQKEVVSLPHERPVQIHSRGRKKRCLYHINALLKHIAVAERSSIFAMFSARRCRSAPHLAPCLWCPSARTAWWAGSQGISCTEWKGHSDERYQACSRICHARAGILEAWSWRWCAGQQEWQQWQG